MNKTSMPGKVEWSDYCLILLTGLLWGSAFLLIKIAIVTIPPYTLTMGRTHGVHAEPTTLGLKLTIWYEEMKRNKRRLESALAVTNVGKISGAVGNYAHMPPKLESLVCKELGITPSPASTPERALGP